MNTSRILSAALTVAAYAALGTFSQTADAQTLADRVTLPANVSVYAMTTNNDIFVLPSGGSVFFRLGAVTFPDGSNLIGIDFRPADGKLYALTDSARLFTIDVSATNFGAAALVSTLANNTNAGLAGLMDFNPQVNALRIQDNNENNIAVVNSNGGNLNATAVQTKLAYTSGDVNAGKNPEIVGGAYNNNRAGTARTLFYAVDHSLDTLVTIADKTATGSSNTGGGKLQTIGSLVDQNGRKLNFSSAADLDIYTDVNGTNFLVGFEGTNVFSISLAQINPALAVGNTQNVVVRQAPMQINLAGITSPITGSFADVALQTGP